MEPSISANVILLSTAYALFTLVSDLWVVVNNISRIYEFCEDIFKMKASAHSRTRGQMSDT